MSVFVDPSDITYVYGCEECHWWRGVAFSEDAAEEQAIRHEEQEHGSNLRRRARDRRRARRHAKTQHGPKVDAYPPEAVMHGMDQRPHEARV